MEPKEGPNPQSNYEVPPRVESSTQPTETPPVQESPMEATRTPQPSLALESPTHATGNVPFGSSSGLGWETMGTFEKKKRGRPRKNNSDGAGRGNTSGSGPVLSPDPISARPSGDPATQPPSGGFSSDKKGKGKHKPREPGPEDIGEGRDLFTGSSFIPHVLIAYPGEDVTEKIATVMEQKQRSICIISGAGCIKDVTLWQDNNSDDMTTYEGIFQIVSLSGLLIPEEVGRVGKSGGLSISFMSPSRYLIGGVVCGILTAATPVHIMLGSFLLPGGIRIVEPKQKRAKSAQKGPQHVPLFKNKVDQPIFDGPDGQSRHHGAQMGSSSALEFDPDDGADRYIGADDEGKTTTDINNPLHQGK